MGGLGQVGTAAPSAVTSRPAAPALVPLPCTGSAGPLVNLIAATTAIAPRPSTHQFQQQQQQQPSVANIQASLMHSAPQFPSPGAATPSYPRPPAPATSQRVLPPSGGADPAPVVAAVSEGASPSGATASEHSTLPDAVGASMIEGHHEPPRAPGAAAAPCSAAPQTSVADRPARPAAPRAGGSAQEFAAHLQATSTAVDERRPEANHQTGRARLLSVAAAAGAMDGTGRVHSTDAAAINAMDVDDGEEGVVEVPSTLRCAAPHGAASVMATVASEGCAEEQSGGDDAEMHAASGPAGLSEGAHVAAPPAPAIAQVGGPPSAGAAPSQQGPTGPAPPSAQPQGDMRSSLATLSTGRDDGAGGSVDMSPARTAEPQHKDEAGGDADEEEVRRASVAAQDVRERDGDDDAEMADGDAGAQGPEASMSAQGDAAPEPAAHGEEEGETRAEKWEWNGENRNSINLLFCLCVLLFQAQAGTKTKRRWPRAASLPPCLIPQLLRHPASGHQPAARALLKVPRRQRFRRSLS
jgi:hypothetical protein